MNVASLALASLLLVSGCTGNGGTDDTAGDDTGADDTDSGDTDSGDTDSGDTDSGDTDTGNGEPVPDAGPDQIVHNGDFVTLDGSGSHDPEGSTLTYEWTQVGGATVVLSDPYAAGPTFTAPLTTGQLAFYLVVSDGQVSSAPDLVQVEVANAAPTADAGSDSSVYKRDPMTLFGIGSADADGDDLTYEWTQLSGTAVVLSDATASLPGFDAPGVSGALVFELTVVDAYGLSSADQVTVTVNNRAPFVYAGDDQQVQKGDEVELDATASQDADEDDLSYEWTQVSGVTVTLSDATSATPSFTAPSDGGNIAFDLVVSDGEVEAEDQVTVNVVNQEPTADAGDDVLANKGETVELDGTASTDADGDALTYLWVQASGTTVVLSDATAATPSFTAPSATGVLQFDLYVSDVDNQSQPDRVAVTIENQAPTADAGPDQTPGVLSTVTLDGSGSSDPDPDSLSYAWTQTAGPTVTLSSSTAQKPTFTAPPTIATYTFQLVVSDGDDTDSDTVGIALENEAPEADAGSDIEANGGEIVWLDGTGSFDPEGGRLTYRWEQITGTTIPAAHTNSSMIPLSVPEAGGVSTWELTVSDGASESTDMVTVDVTPYAGTAQHATIGTHPQVTTTTNGFRHGDADSVAQRTSGGVLSLWAGTPLAEVAFNGGPSRPLLGHGGDVILCGDWGSSTDGVLEVWRRVGSNLVKVEVTGGLALQGEVAFTPDGTMAFVLTEQQVTGTWQHQIVAVDLSDPSAPTTLALSLGSTVTPKSLSATNDRLYVGIWYDAPDDLRSYEIAPLKAASPAWGTATESHACDLSVRDLAVRDDVLYTACPDGLAVWDVSTTTPSLRSSVPEAKGEFLDERNGTVAVGGWSSTVYLVDVSDPDDPQLDDIHVMPRVANGPFAIELDWSSLFENVAVRSSATQQSSQTIGSAGGLPDPATTISTAALSALGAEAGLLFAGGSNTGVYDVADPVAPESMGTVSSVAWNDGYALRNPGTVLVGAQTVLKEFDLITGASTVRATGTFFGHLRLVGDDHAVVGQSTGYGVVDLASGDTNTLNVYQPMGIDLAGPIAWALLASGALVSYDMTDPEAPVPGDFLTFQQGGENLAAYGSFLLAHNYDSVQSWPVSGTTPSSPASGPFSGNGLLSGRASAGTGSLFVLGHDGGLDVLDVADPTAPVQVAHYSSVGAIDLVAADAGWAWAYNDDAQDVEGYALAAAQWVSPTVTAAPSEVLTIEFTWSDDVANGWYCVVNGGSKTAGTVSPGFGHFEWTVPAAPGDYEVACWVGVANDFVVLRDRVRVAP